MNERAQFFAPTSGLSLEQLPFAAWVADANSHWLESNEAALNMREPLQRAAELLDAIAQSIDSGETITLRNHDVDGIGGFFLDGVAAQEIENKHIRSIVARKEFMDALDLPPEDWDMRNHVSFAHFVWPNTVMVWHPDYISQLSLYPTAVDETVVMHSCLVPRAPESEKEQAHYERGFEIIENGVFGPEDLHICEQAQIGMASGANDTLMIGGHENGLRNFYQIIEDHMGPYRPA